MTVKLIYEIFDYGKTLIVCSTETTIHPQEEICIPWIRIRAHRLHIIFVYRNLSANNMPSSTMRKAFGKVTASII